MVFPTLPRLVGIWQKWLGSWAKWLNPQSKVNQTKVYDQMVHTALKIAVRVTVITEAQ